jgi:hypothetical protein
MKWAVEILFVERALKVQECDATAATFLFKSLVQHKQLKLFHT